MTDFSVLVLQTNVRNQLTRMEKEVEDLKQRVQLTKLDLTREQQVTCWVLPNACDPTYSTYIVVQCWLVLCLQDHQQVGSESKALRKQLMGRRVPRSGAPGV